MKRLLATLAIFAVLSGPALAQGGPSYVLDDVQSMRDGCEALERPGGSNDMRAAMCLAYADAVHNAVVISRQYCSPELRAAKTMAVVRAFMVWSEQNPSMWDSPPYVGFNNAIVETWPCQ